MPSQRETSTTGPAKRKAEVFDEEKEKRAERKRIRTEWRTDATVQEKETSLRVAMNNIGGGKKYSWLQQGPVTVAETLGQKRAVELGIKTGKLAEELKIGEFRGDGPSHLECHWEELRGAGINYTREEFAKMLRESGASEEQIQASLAPRPKKIVGRSASSVREQSGVVAPVETTPAPIKPTKVRGKKRAASSDDSEAVKAPAKKRRTNAKTAARVPPTPPKSSPPPVIDLEAEDDTPENAPQSLTTKEIEAPANDETPQYTSIVDELEALLEEELASKATDPVAEEDDGPFAPPSPTVPDLEASFDKETSECSATAEELEAQLEEDTSSQSHDPTSEEDKLLFAPPSPSLSELEAQLEEELG
ncbi:hypothetical protein F5Y03DRAFT_396983 [Xylaria venustula]|nr:hypothetical protein F5Y03DRAFT_396983 [Xylaria venustula]